MSNGGDSSDGDGVDDPEERGRLDRRRVLLAGAGATAVAWVAPAILSVPAAAGASSVPTPVPLINTMFGIDSVTKNLYSVNTDTGAFTVIGATGVTSPSGLGYDSNSGVLYGTEVYPNATAQIPSRMYTVNQATGAWTLLGLTGTARAASFFYDADADVLYGGDVKNIGIYIVNRTTGAWTAWSTGQSAARWGLALDTNTGILYAVSSSTFSIVSRTTGGNITLVNSNQMGVSAPRNMAYDPVKDIVFGVANNGILYQVNRATGRYSAVGGTGFTSATGLAYAN